MPTPSPSSSDPSVTAPSPPENEGAENEGAATTDAEPLRLSPRSYWLSLILVVGLFFGLHPIWEAIDIAQLDATIWWSYVPIPFIVVGLLVWERRFNGAGWLLDTLSLTFVKFAVTFLAANILWSITGTPDLAGRQAPAPTASHGSGPFAVRPAPAQTRLDPADVGILDGRLVDAEGRPAPGALVWIAAGLEAHAFPPPEEPLVIEIGAEALLPAWSVVQVHQPVQVRNHDAVLHAAQARIGSGRWLFTFPVLAHGDKSFMFSRAHGDVTLACDLPDHTEAAAELFVVGHPFASRTDAAGAFRFDGVPAGPVTLRARFADGTGFTQAVDVLAGRRLAVRIEP